MVDAKQVQISGLQGRVDVLQGALASQRTLAQDLQDRRQAARALKTQVERLRKENVQLARRLGEFEAGQPVNDPGGSFTQRALREKLNGLHSERDGWKARHAETSILRADETLTWQQRYDAQLLQAQNMEVAAAAERQRLQAQAAAEAAAIMHDRDSKLAAHRDSAEESFAAARAAHAKEIQRRDEDNNKLRMYAVKLAVGRWAGPLRLAFGAWRELAAAATARSRARKALLSRAAQRWTNRHLSAAFSAWHQLVLKVRRQAVLVSRALRRMADRALRAAFSEWSDADARQRRARIVRRAVLKMQNRALAAAYAGWLARSRRAQRHKAVVRRMLNRIRSRELSTAFYLWANEAKVAPLLLPLPPPPPPSRGSTASEDGAASTPSASGLGWRESAPSTPSSLFGGGRFPRGRGGASTPSEPGWVDGESTPSSVGRSDALRERRGSTSSDEGRAPMPRVRLPARPAGGSAAAAARQLAQGMRDLHSRASTTSNASTASSGHEQRRRPATAGLLDGAGAHGAERGSVMSHAPMRGEAPRASSGRAAPAAVPTPAGEHGQAGPQQPQRQQPPQQQPNPPRPLPPAMKGSGAGHSTDSDKSTASEGEDY